MRFVSSKSIHTDPYRAGFEIGEALAPISPEVVLLFASMSYEPDFSDFFEALYDALGRYCTAVIYPPPGRVLMPRRGKRLAGVGRSSRGRASNER